MIPFLIMLAGGIAVLVIQYIYELNEENFKDYRIFLYFSLIVEWTVVIFSLNYIFESLSDKEFGLKNVFTIFEGDWANIIAKLILLAAVYQLIAHLIIGYRNYLLRNSYDLTLFYIQSLITHCKFETSLSTELKNEIDSIINAEMLDDKNHKHLEFALKLMDSKEKNKTMQLELLISKIEREKVKDVLPSYSISKLLIRKLRSM